MNATERVYGRGRGGLARAAVREVVQTMGGEASAYDIGLAADVPEGYTRGLLMALEADGVVVSRRTPQGLFWRRATPAKDTCLHIYQPTGPCGCLVKEGRVCIGLKCVHCGLTGHWLVPVRCAASEAGVPRW